jgi:hypothetical protein
LDVGSYEVKTPIVLSYLKRVEIDFRGRCLGTPGSTPLEFGDPEVEYAFSDRGITPESNSPPWSDERAAKAAQEAAATVDETVLPSTKVTFGAGVSVKSVLTGARLAGSW